MFRMEEVILGGWQEKTVEAMQRRRFEGMVSRLPQLGTQRLESLSPREFSRRLEVCWQDIEKKPMRMQQIAQVRQRVLSSVQLHADCLSREEHALLERAIILGGSARIQDVQELEAAQALSLRLWGHVGVVSGHPYIELERGIMEPAARAIARDGHEEIRTRFELFTRKLSALLYRYGAVDDRVPQRMIVQEVLCKDAGDEHFSALARRFLWASFDCIDYNGHVVLLHSALAEPRDLLMAGRRMPCAYSAAGLTLEDGEEILPEEVPLQDALERAIRGAMRRGIQEKEMARDLRFLCKQGAPLHALEEILQSGLIVLLSPAMRAALMELYYMTPKWTNSFCGNAFQ